MSAAARAGETSAYLSTLICASDPDARYLELRWRSQSAPMRSEWFVEPGMLTSAEHLRRSLVPVVRRIHELADRGADVYTGVSLRTRQEGTKDAIPTLGIAWADCDSPEATTRLGAFQFAPSMIVQSSPGRTHAYWKLERPHPAESVEDVNRRLALALGADPKVADAARILRVPGTFNRKTEVAQPVALVSCRATVTRLDDLMTLPAATKATATTTTTTARAATVTPTSTRVALRGTAADGLADLRAIPATVYVPLLTGREVGRDGKACCPVHGGGAERTPSLHAYPDPDRGWYCWGCEKGGDVLDLVGHMTGLDTRSRSDFPRIVAIARSHLGGGR